MASAWAVAPALAGTSTTLYQFTGGDDGATPSSSVVYDEKGDLYGETDQGGDFCPQGLYIGCGTVYKLSAAGQLTTLVTFTGLSNGASSIGQLTLVDHTLYGNAYKGGANNDGVLFSVHTNGAKFTLLHTFNGSDGIGPDGRLIPGPAGAFYGITAAGGPNPKHIYSGVLFELMPDGTYVHLHDFTGGADGGGPGTLVIDASGTLYGSTSEGAPCTGETSCGVVYEYVPSTGTFTVLHQFLGADGIDPMLGSIGSDGTLYGATRDSKGEINAGSLFELVPSGGAYTLTTLYDFKLNQSAGGPGYEPSGGPILTPYGALIGTTDGGESPSLYSLKFNHMRVLSTFAPSTNPVPPTLDRNGIIYGAVASGGITPCTIVGYANPGGCGYVYSFMQ